MSVINKNFIVKSLRGVIPPKSLDLIDFDDSAVQIIARVLNNPDSDLDRSIISKVLKGYFESRRRQPIANKSAFIISSIRKAFGIRKQFVSQSKHEPQLAWLTERS